MALSGRFPLFRCCFLPSTPSSLTASSSTLPLLSSHHPSLRHQTHYYAPLPSPFLPRTPSLLLPSRTYLKPRMTPSIKAKLRESFQGMEQVFSPSSSSSALSENDSLMSMWKTIKKLFEGAPAIENYQKIREKTNGLFSILVQELSEAETALHVLKTFVKADPLLVNHKSFILVAGGCFAENNTVAAEECFQLMLESIPNQKEPKMWNEMMRGYGILNQHEDVVRIFKDLQSRGIEPNNATYLSLMKSMGKQGLVGEMKQIWEENVEPNLTNKNFFKSYEVFLHGLVGVSTPNHQDYQNALYCLSKVQERIHPDLTEEEHRRAVRIHSLLLLASGRTGHFERLGYGLQEMRDLGLKINIDCINSAFSGINIYQGAAPIGKAVFHEVQQMLENIYCEMAAEGLEPDNTTRKCFKYSARYSPLFRDQQQFDEQKKPNASRGNLLLLDPTLVPAKWQSKTMFELYLKLVEKGMKPDALTISVLFGKESTKNPDLFDMIEDERVRLKIPLTQSIFINRLKSAAKIKPQNQALPRISHALSPLFSSSFPTSAPNFMHSLGCLANSPYRDALYLQAGSIIREMTKLDNRSLELFLEICLSTDAGNESLSRHLPLIFEKMGGVKGGVRDIRAEEGEEGEEVVGVVEMGLREGLVSSGVWSTRGVSLLLKHFLKMENIMGATYCLDDLWGFCVEAYGEGNGRGVEKGRGQWDVEQALKASREVAMFYVRREEGERAWEVLRGCLGLGKLLGVKESVMGEKLQKASNSLVEFYLERGEGELAVEVVESLGGGEVGGGVEVVSAEVCFAVLRWLMERREHDKVVPFLQLCSKMGIKGMQGDWEGMEVNEEW